MYNLPQQLRHALKRDGRSSAVIGAAAGVHPVNVRKFRAGADIFSIDTMLRLAEVLGLHVVISISKKK
jgi:hypothetical protein